MSLIEISVQEEMNKIGLINKEEKGEIDQDREIKKDLWKENNKDNKN